MISFSTLALTSLYVDRDSLTLYITVGSISLYYLEIGMNDNVSVPQCCFSIVSCDDRSVLTLY